MSNSNEMRPTLSVLITYYNEKDLVQKGLRSLLDQDQPPDEILLYDDVSEFPPEEYIPKDWPVKIYHGEKNQGPRKAQDARSQHTPAQLAAGDRPAEKPSRGVGGH